MTDAAITAPDRATIGERTLATTRALLVEIQGSEHAGAHASLDSAFERDLRLDSLSRAELLLRLERAFGIELHEDTLARAATPRELVDAIEHALRTPHAPQRPQAVSVRDAVSPGATFSAPLELVLPEAHAPVPETVATLVEAMHWLRRMQPDREQIRYLSGGAQTSLTHRALWTAAEQIAANLQAYGFEPGETASIMLPTGPRYFEVFLGVLLAGGIPVPIYPPTRAAQLAEHVRRHAGILANARAGVLIADRQTHLAAQMLRAHARDIRLLLSPDQLARPGAAYEAVSIAPDDIAFIQYTSGSTGDPKGVVLTHRNLLANLRAMGALVQPREDDVFVSWLPLYHDMGLIGAWFGSMLHAMPLVVMSPLAFLSRPARWLQAMHAHRGTISAAPNFAYELCVRRIDDAELQGVDLSRWRLAFNGAEAVMPHTLQRFADRFARFGLRRAALTPVYGLAESSVGLAFPPLERGPQIDRIDRDTFARERRAVPAAQGDVHALEFVSCGRVLPGHALRIVAESGASLPERMEGRIEFQGPSATSGYFRNSRASRQLIKADWLDTGDRGYLAGAELFVTGREKDIVIRAGRNLYPHEIEEAVGEVAGVRKGCVAVFGRHDPVSATERLVVVAETRLTEPAARAALQAAIARAVVDVIGEPADAIVLATPHTVLKTSSGKVRRAATRDAFAMQAPAGGDTSATKDAAIAMPSPLIGRAGLAWYALRTLVRRYADRAAHVLYGLYAWAVFVPIAALAWLSVAVTRRPATSWRITRAAMRTLLCATGVRLKVMGTEHLPAAGKPYVLVANHASYLDGGVLVAAIRDPLAFAAKREFEAHWMTRRFLSRLGAVPVERFDAAGGVRDTDRLVELVRSGARLALFPEGTFTRAVALQPLRLGAFLVAARANVPIVPVAIRGTHTLLGAHQWLPRHARIEVVIGPPIPQAIAAGVATDEAFARANVMRRQTVRFLLEEEAG